MATIITPDYYETLELDRNATQEDIKEAYRNLSLRFHPNKATEALSAVYNYKFHKIAEAYTVLSDPNKKGIYDIYGKEGLYKGIRDKKTNNLKGGYKYKGNADEIFHKFMEETNPFSLIRDNDRMDDVYGGIFSSSTGGQNEKEPEKLKSINIDLYCTLEELYNGTIKTIKYKKNEFNTDKRTTVFKEKSLDVEIFPGYDNNTILTFSHMGNDAPGLESSDLIVHIKELPHKRFKRINKADLIYYHDISLSQALNSQGIPIDTLDGRKLNIPMDEIISPSTVKLVKGEGMPINNKKEDMEKYLFETQKGDLFIKFNIIFPDYINGKKKERIVELLSQA